MHTIYHGKKIRRFTDEFNSSFWIGSISKNIKTSEYFAAALHTGTDYVQGNYLGKAERAIKTTIPLQLSEKFKAERWRRQISSIYQQH